MQPIHTLLFIIPIYQQNALFARIFVSLFPPIAETACVSAIVPFPSPGYSYPFLTTVTASYMRAHREICGLGFAFKAPVNNIAI
jgi:hypothetical protein